MLPRRGGRPGDISTKHSAGDGYHDRDSPMLGAWAKTETGEHLLDTIIVTSDPLDSEGENGGYGLWELVGGGGSACICLTVSCQSLRVTEFVSCSHLLGPLNEKKKRLVVGIVPLYRRLAPILLLAGSHLVLGCRVAYFLISPLSFFTNTHLVLPRPLL